MNEMFDEYKKFVAFRNGHHEIISAAIRNIIETLIKLPPTAQIACLHGIKAEIEQILKRDPNRATSEHQALRGPQKGDKP